MPFPVQFALAVDFTNRVRAVEKDTLEGLEKAGFKLDFGIDGAGISRQYITRGGGYYIDVGCSSLIIDGKIKLKHSPEGISGFDERGLILKDDSKLEADIVVLATGYDNMRTTVRKVLGDRVADRLVDVWDLDEEGELNGVCLTRSFQSTAFKHRANENTADVASKWSPRLLVHGRKPGHLPDLLQVPGPTDQGHRVGA